MKQRSLHAKALHEGRNGQYRHRVYNSNNDRRVNTHDLLKEYYNESNQEEREEEQQATTPSYTLRTGREEGRTTGEVVESSNGPDRERDQR